MKTKRKILWLDLWQIAEQEAWLADKAAKGWELTKMTGLTANFKKAAPQTITYKTDIFKEPISQNPEQLKQYEQAGWRYVASRGHLHFFRNNSQSTVKEIHTDPIHQAETIRLLKTSLKIRAYLIALLTLIGIALAVFMLTLDPVRNYLNDEFLSPIIQIFIFIGINLLILKGLIHLNKLIKILQSNQRIQPVPDFRKKYYQNKIIGLSVISFFAVFFLYEFSKSGNTTLAKSFPPIPEKELPVVQMDDFTDKTNHKPYFYDQNSNRDNYYSVNSSILVPEQYELQQHVEVEGEKWEDGSGPYRPSLTSRQYIFLNEVLAKRLFQYLIDSEEELHRGDATFPNTTVFDELVVLENSVLSRKGHIIYYVTYYGKESVEEIIHAMELLLTDEAQRS
ncbi:DUF2812 domain-containing protein [Sutcliffiella horikoshii]|uniref:DUF2812 domain-containing protein n=1 Tax=Sutcliffiella horikoshii TaxID=79883 RepID=A0A5D4SK65_9BACI|nr:DUF2812 domain-containing protein [Sutcliffiella horikoshii]TYS63623.1 DUF2812 domain-containing protein [Sutcliffiella horikoshii]